MKVIYFSELLNLIREGKQPDEVWHNHQRFKYDKTLKMYINDKNRVSLMEARINSTYGKHAEVHDMFMDDVFTDFWVEYNTPILDNVEKEYLLNIIKPFKEDIGCITKRLVFNFHDNGRRLIEITTDGGEHIFLPVFSIESGMYAGMEDGVEYTLEELGI